MHGFTAESVRRVARRSASFSDYELEYAKLRHAIMHCAITHNTRELRWYLSDREVLEWVTVQLERGGFKVTQSMADLLLTVSWGVP